MAGTLLVKREAFYHPPLSGRVSALKTCSVSLKQGMTIPAGDEGPVFKIFLVKSY